MKAPAIPAYLAGTVTTQAWQTLFDKVVYEPGERYAEYEIRNEPLAKELMKHAYTCDIRERTKRYRMALHVMWLELTKPPWLN